MVFEAPEGTDYEAWRQSLFYNVKLSWSQLDDDQPRLWICFPCKVLITPLYILLDIILMILSIIAFPIGSIIVFLLEILQCCLDTIKVCSHWSSFVFIYLINFIGSVVNGILEDMDILVAVQFVLFRRIFVRNFQLVFANVSHKNINLLCSPKTTKSKIN